MKRVRIVTDSTADIPDDMASELDISVVPCLVYFGKQAYRERVDLAPLDFYKRMASSPVLPRTSQPALHDFVETYGRLFGEAQTQGVTSIHVAGNLSGTVNAAWTAAQQMLEPSKLEVIDSGSVSMGLGWVVIKAARMARAGATMEEIGQQVRALLPRAKTAAMVDNLDDLRRGGRINQITAVLGTALQIKPLINIGGGEVTIWGKVRSRSRALKRLAAEVESWGPLDEMVVLHGGAEELAQSLAEMVSESAPYNDLRIEPAGPALITHLGLGAVGVCGLVANSAQ